jgi:zinc transporter, ZIP family
LNNVVSTTLIGFFVGIVGTGLGGSLAFGLKNPTVRLLSAIIGLAGGLMIAIVTFELLPEAFMAGGVGATVIGVGVGSLGASYLDGIITRLNKKIMSRNTDYMKTAILMGIGIALHNFPEGLAIGSGFAAHQKLGVGLAIVIALHNMPEGMAMVTPLRAGGYSRYKAFLLASLAGAPMGFGAFAGAYIGEIAYDFIGLCLALAGGTMLYITFGELIPKAKELHSGRLSTIFAVGGFILGMLISKTF